MPPRLNHPTLPRRPPKPSDLESAARRTLKLAATIGWLRGRPHAVRYSAGVIACTLVRWLRSKLPDHPQARQVTVSAPTPRLIGVVESGSLSAASAASSRLWTVRRTAAISWGRSSGETGFFRTYAATILATNCFMVVLPFASSPSGWRLRRQARAVERFSAPAARPWCDAVRRVDRYYLAIDQPIEQVAQRREALFDRRCLQLAR
jgi:hypothetical protein